MRYLSNIHGANAATAVASRIVGGWAVLVALASILAGCNDNPPPQSTTVVEPASPGQVVVPAQGVPGPAGATGPAGAAGPAGASGASGAQGAPGATGAAGASGAAGSNGSTNQGTP